LLNRAIKFDEKTRHRLIELGACSIAFKLRGTDAIVVVTVGNGDLSLSSDCESKPDVQIEGGFSDFIAMARTQRDGTTLAAGKVEIQGDLATAQLIQTVIAEASFDWEELIAQRTGDVIARQIGRGLRSGIGWVRATRAVLERDMGEYLLYEQRLLPTQREIEHFVQDGAAVAAGVERLNARISRIRRKRDLS
jgi:ubiquinone biosynthesis protein UbiJ